FRSRGPEWTSTSASRSRANSPLTARSRRSRPPQAALPSPSTAVPTAACPWRMPPCAAGSATTAATSARGAWKSMATGSRTRASSRPPSSTRWPERPDAVGAERLAGADEGDPALAELARQIAEGAEPIGVAHAVGVTARCQMHADPPRGGRRPGRRQGTRLERIRMRRGELHAQPSPQGARLAGVIRHRKEGTRCYVVLRPELERTFPGLLAWILKFAGRA